MNTQARRIDVHHHFLPPKFMAELNRLGVQWTGGPAKPVWNLDIARETMARNGIEAAVASPVPQVHWGDDAAAAWWARHCNEFTARAVHDDPAHFGGLATLPLPDAEAALRELEHAYDVLRLDGVILQASNGTKYLGDPAFEELFAELDRRRAIVLIHPNTVPPGATVPELSIPWGLVEFPFDTSRAVANLLYNGLLERYPNVRYIVSHAGGAIPYLALRLQLGTELPGVGDRVPKGVPHYLRNLYYDTALSPSEPVLAALREFAAPGHVLFGSDWPMVPEKVVQIETALLEGSRVLDDAARRAIDRDNALALFPRFAAS